MKGVKLGIEDKREKILAGEAIVSLDTNAMIKLSERSPEVIEKALETQTFWNIGRKLVGLNSKTETKEWYLIKFFNTVTDSECWNFCSLSL